ncbi:MAG: hypothetical protein HY895_03170 [Deltaproteobacteria bacterium]|nr:hypothetical protein [Deltaproteobacteria bacterium]
MGSLSDFAENEVLDHILGVGAYTPPATVYLALSTADPTDAGSGLAEPSGNGYARTAIAFGAASARAIANSAVVTFPQASGAWGTITHWALMHAAAGGSMLAHGEVEPDQAIVALNTPSFAIGQIQVSWNTGAISTYLANKVLDFLFRNQAFTPPTIHAGLATAAIADATTGTTVTEPSGNNYARKAHAAWDAASGGASENTGALTFNTPSGAWGTIIRAFLADAATLGNILFYATQSPSQAPQNGDTVSYPDGAWDVSLS